MKLAVGADEKTPLTDALTNSLRERGHELKLFGPLAGRDEYWPAVAQQVAGAVAAGSADEGILLCWTGTGVSMAANKVQGIRAALCRDAQTARGARLWNNANVLCLSLRATSQPVADEILESWFSTRYEPNQVDDACLAQLAEIERVHMGAPEVP